MILVRQLAQIFLTILLTVFGAASALAIPSDWKLVQYHFAHPTVSVQSPELGGTGISVGAIANLEKEALEKAVESALKRGATNRPLGFGSAKEFADFGKDLNAGLRKAGVDDAQGIFQGSSVTGKSFRTGKPFDQGRTSDFDIAISSPQLMQRARDAGISLRSGGTRTGPLSPAELRTLGLYDVRQQLGQQAGRKVEFMLFDSVSGATARGPSIMVPK